VAGGLHPRRPGTRPPGVMTTTEWLPRQSGPAYNAGYSSLRSPQTSTAYDSQAPFNGQHTFADGRDPLDVMVDLGATYRFVGRFRAGVEYAPKTSRSRPTGGAGGGARPLLGPIASLQLWQRSGDDRRWACDRVSVVAFARRLLREWRLRRV